MERRTAPSPVGAGMGLPHLLPFQPSLLVSWGRNEGQVSFVNQEHEQPILPQPEVNLPDNDHNPMASIRRRRDCFEMYQIYEILKAHSVNPSFHETGEAENWVAGHVVEDMRTRLNPSNRSVEELEEPAFQECAKNSEDELEEPAFQECAKNSEDELEEPAFQECAKNSEEHGFSSLKNQTDTYVKEDDTGEEEWLRVKDLRLCSCCKRKCHSGRNCRRALNVTTGLEETEREEEEAEEVTRGGVGVETIKLLGQVENKDIVIMIDSGSTHSFLDPKIVKDMATVECVKSPPLKVTVANGNEFSCDLVCPKFEWTVQGETFVKEMRLVRMGGYDMVLGMDWIHQFTPVMLSTRPPSVTFRKEGRLIELVGVTDTTEEAVGNSSSSY
ncbi:unnamed protein product [Cuscuta europaea]|uniref:Uncharacterized protein n=1 Tax=Cuscuta europaea TaxID=41803 RepID=A0A9P0ZFS2_CUSEU|nr:unnamed protein product [Cuscuta europaea]